MQHHDAVVGERPRALAKERGVVADADVLEHADRDDPVIVLGDITVVLHPEFNVEALFARASASDVELFVGQCYAGYARACDLRKIKRKPAPAPADVELALAWVTQEQLRR